MSDVNSYDPDLEDDMFPAQLNAHSAPSVLLVSPDLPTIVPIGHPTTPSSNNVNY